MTGCRCEWYLQAIKQQVSAQPQEQLNIAAYTTFSLPNKVSGCISKAVQPAGKQGVGTHKALRQLDGGMTAPG